MDPNPQPTPAGPQTQTDPVVEFIRSDRQTAAYVLLGLAIVCLAATIWLAWRGEKRAAGAEPDKTAEKAQDPFNPEPEAAKPEVTDPSSRDYRLGWVACMLAFTALAGQGAWLLAGLPPPTEAAQRTEARKVVLRVGAALGTILILAGVGFFYRWSDSLGGWLDRGEAKEAKWVVIPLLMVVFGAGLIFLAIQPARAEERNNATLRWLVYGSNLGLTVLLLFVALLVANVAFAVRVPNRLDTTSSGFYTLSDPTREFLAQLDHPVTLYGILPDSGQREVEDIRRLLQLLQDAGGGKVRVRFISPTLNKADLAALRARYPQLEVNDIGVLVTAGEDEKRSTFLRADEFFDREPPSMSRQAAPQQTFVGESKLLRELRFLAENQQRPAVYFTQSNGELDVGGPAGPEPAGEDQSAGQLKAYLEKNYLDVRPLKFDPLNPKVPDDAEVIIIAAPRTAFGAPVVDALRKFMTDPRPGGKKGKLIVLVGAPEPRQATKVTPTGLEPLLRDFGVNLGDKYIFGLEGREPIIGEMPTGFSQASARARNPITLALRNHPPVLFLPREVGVAAGNATFRATPLLLTVNDYTWLEEEFPKSLNQMMADLARNPRAKQGSDSPRSVGVVVSEGAAGPGAGGAGRMVVIGSGLIGSDLWAQRTRGGAPVEFDLIGAAIDWLRDRPPVPSGVASKTYTTYTFPPKVDGTRILWFPLGLALLTVLGLGAGVWVVRRK